MSAPAAAHSIFSSHSLLLVQPDPLRLLLYVACFPQLIAGPIVRYGDVRDLYLRLEAEGKEITPRDYTLGLWLAEGRRAWYVPGDPPGRMKITTAHDRDVFEALLLRQAWLEGKGEKKP